MLVSVIVPVYNVEKFLTKCVESICENSYRDLEIILVDDGSTDTSGKICDSYRIRDSRIVVVHKLNGGLSSARNAGIEIAKGDYILFIDSDDYIEKNMIEHLVKGAIKSGAQVVQAGFKKIDEYSNILYTFCPNTHYCNNNTEVLNEFFVEANINVTAWGKLYKTELFKNGLRFMEGKNNEDNIFITDLLESVNSYMSINYAEYNYLIRKNSIMNQTFNEKKLDAIYAMQYMIDKCNILWPDYRKYACTRACRTCFYVYCDLRKSNSYTAEYKDIILDEFNNNIICSDKHIKKFAMRHRVELILFKYFPNLTADLHNKMKRLQEIHLENRRKKMNGLINV